MDADGAGLTLIVFAEEVGHAPPTVLVMVYVLAVLDASVILPVEEFSERP